jgi:FixJ family two-component response regulator
MSQVTVHIVDDDASVREGLGALLRVEGLPARLYASGQALLDAKPEGGGCVVTDLHMAKMSGIELTRRLRAQGSDLPVMVVTGRAERAMRREALSAGAAVFLDKPFTPDEFVGAVRSLLSGDARPAPGAG